VSAIDPQEKAKSFQVQYPIKMVFGGNAGTADTMCLSYTSKQEPDNAGFS